jgi:hypothetical protein
MGFQRFDTGTQPLIQNIEKMVRLLYVIYNIDNQ